LAAVGNNGKVLTDVIPDWKLVIGAQPEVPALPPAEAQNRFRRVFQNVVKVFASAAHPLIVFLDDLQWADHASIQLIEILLDDQELTHVLFIGATRDSEVEAGHPLGHLLDHLEKNNRATIWLNLQPLGVEHVQQLLAEMLKADDKQVHDLALLVCAASSQSLTIAGYLLCAALGQIELGYSIADASLKMIERFEEPFPRPEVRLGFFNWTAYWRGLSKSSNCTPSRRIWS
jgi:hypothetical protein